MNFLTVLTCPRSKSYLGDTLASLERAGAESVLRRVVVDGGQPVSAWPAISLGSTPQGNLRAFFEVLRIAYQTGATQLLYCEDDIIACKNAVPCAFNVGVPPWAAFTAFFDMKEMPRGLQAGLYRVSIMGLDGQGVWGFQAVLFPRRTIARLLEARERILSKGGHMAFCDVLAARELLFDLPDYAVCVPNLFEHVGEASALWTRVSTWSDYEINRRSVSFPGESFDAATLPFFAGCRLVGQIKKLVQRGTAVILPDATQELEDLLRLLDSKGVPAPRVIERTPEGLFVEVVRGRVPAEPFPVWSATVLGDAGQLLRKFHDVTGKTHGDFAPNNLVFDGERLAALLDFDTVASGDPLSDVVHACWRWCSIGPDGGVLEEQQARVGVFVEAHGKFTTADVLARLPGYLETMADIWQPGARRARDWIVENLT